MKIKEIKHHIDGHIEEFLCDVVEIGERYAIVNFVWHRDNPLNDGPFSLPAGEIHTRAYFWTDRHYLIYEISLNNEQLLGHRFDVCENVTISQGEISFQDLELDLWVDLAGQIHVLDEEDVLQHAQNGLITNAQFHRIEQTKRDLLANHQQVIRNLKR